MLQTRAVLRRTPQGVVKESRCQSSRPSQTCCHHQHLLQLALHPRAQVLHLMEALD